MLRDITIGQYYPADSVIHKLDPRVKLFATLIFIISLFSFKNVWGFLVATIFMFGFIELSKVPIGYMVKGLKSDCDPDVITALFNLFLTSGKELVSFLDLYDYLRGTAQRDPDGNPSDLSDSWYIGHDPDDNAKRIDGRFRKALAPMNKIHVPVHEIAMMMSIALRFIPILVEETDKDHEGTDGKRCGFETGGVIQRAKNMIRY